MRLRRAENDRPLCVSGAQRAQWQTEITVRRADVMVKDLPRVPVRLG